MQNPHRGFHKLTLSDVGGRGAAAVVAAKKTSNRFGFGLVRLRMQIEFKPTLTSHSKKFAILKHTRVEKDVVSNKRRQQKVDPRSIQGHSMKRMAKLELFGRKKLFRILVSFFD